MEQESDRMIEELKPCPFCGSANLNWYFLDVDNRGDPFDPCIKCKDCGLTVKFYGERQFTKGMHDIRDAWNRRVRR